MRRRITVLGPDDEVLHSTSVDVDCRWGTNVGIGLILAHIASTSAPFPDGTVAVVRSTPEDAAMNVFEGVQTGHPVLWPWRNATGSFPAAFVEVPSGRPAWNPNVDGNIECRACGHDYMRHFDDPDLTDDGMTAVGCKYCGCAEPVISDA